MKIKKRLVALLAGISLLCCGLFLACENPTGADNKDGTEITNPNNKDKENNSSTDKTTDKDKAGDKNTSSDKDKTEDKQKDSGKENSTETDENNEKENAGEGDINGKENGGESEGEESDVAEETTLSVGDSSIVIKNTAEGIRFEWDKLPEDTAFVRIMAWLKEFDEFYAYAEINNLSSDNVFIDEYVTAGQEYKYQILAYNSAGALLNEEKEITIKAKGGKGELSIDIEATSEGIKLSGEKQSAESYFYYFKYEKESDDYGDINGLSVPGVKSFDFLDKFVDKDVEYIYKPVEAIGTTVYPRYKCQTVKAIGGAGVNKISLNVENTNEGIKMSWEPLLDSDNIKRLTINLDSIDSKDNLKIWPRNTSITNILVKHIDIGKSYKCYINVYYKDGSSFTSDKIKITASSGLGEGRITNYPAATFDGYNKIQFTEVPKSSLSTDLNYNFEFWYCDVPRKEGDGYMYGYSPNRDKTEVYIEPARGIGNWNICPNYYIHFWYEDDYEYSYNIYDMSNLSGLPQNIVLTEEGRSFLAKPTDEGIKLEWRNLPQETKKIEIQALYVDEYGDKYIDRFTLFEINDPSEIHSVIDKYVDAGKKYYYELIPRDEDGRELQCFYERHITASAGLGEKSFTATAQSDGIHITFEKPSVDYSVYIYKRLSEKQKECHEWFDIGRGDSIPTSVTDVAFTDSFVTSGKEYIYSPCLELKGNSSADIVEYPRYNIVHVKSISTGEKPVITNQPAGTYDEITKILTLTTKPEITSVDGVDSWKVSLDYGRKSGASSGYGLFDVRDNTDDTCEAWSGAGSGMFYLSAYRIWLYFDNYVRYHVENSDISNLSGLPQSVKL